MPSFPVARRSSIDFITKFLASVVPAARKNGEPLDDRTSTGANAVEIRSLRLSKAWMVGTGSSDTFSAGGSAARLSAGIPHASARPCAAHDVLPDRSQRKPARR